MKKVLGQRTGVLNVLLGIAVIFAQPAALANHNSTAPAGYEQLVCGLLVDLADFSDQFDTSGSFDDKRLNRALARAHDHVFSAIADASIPQLTQSFADLKAAMRELEKGASVPVSGTGFADDLASLGSFYAEIFADYLIVLATDSQLVSAAAIEDATLDYIDGMANRDISEWERALGDFGKAVRTLEREIAINPPVCL
jgi:hypothetical protein